MPKMIVIIQGASTPKKKVSSALNRFYGKNDHFHRGGSKKPQKLITTQKKVSAWLNRFHVIACQKWSWSSKVLKNTSKHLKKRSSSLDMIPPHPQLSPSEFLSFLKKKKPKKTKNKKTKTKKQKLKKRKLKNLKNSWNHHTKPQKIA